MEATAKMEATADTAAAEGHRAGAGLRRTQVDVNPIHLPLADQMDHRAPKARSHPPTMREMEAEVADVMEIAYEKPTR